ncbi:MAG: M23 family metallopeptidase [Bacillota bacterium]|nr:M23 family metallopeptidase [Bacillota bacterium]MDW7684394.1 M23 family metallopeptidase [Bacillota bacterium]
MKKVLATLSPLRKIRPSRKFLLFGGYILVITAMIVAVTWQGAPTDPVETPPPAAVETETEDEAVLTRPDPPFNALDEEDVSEEIIPEDPLPVLAVPDTPMVWPLEGQLLIGHHEVYRIGNQLRAHAGVDIEAPEGAEVTAAWPGIVEHVTHDMRLGWLVEIRHGGGYLTQYANLLEEPYFSLGDEVEAGQIIGKVGQSAKLDANTGPFLHFAIYLENQAIDPVSEISPR